VNRALPSPAGVVTATSVSAAVGANRRQSVAASVRTGIASVASASAAASAAVAVRRRAGGVQTKKRVRSLRSTTRLMKRETPRRKRKRRTVRAKSARERSAAVGRRRKNANTAVIGLADVQVRKRILPGLFLSIPACFFQSTRHSALEMS